MKLEYKVKDYQCINYIKDKGCRDNKYLMDSGKLICKGYNYNCSYYVPKSIVINEVKNNGI